MKKEKDWLWPAIVSSIQKAKCLLVGGEVEVGGTKVQTVR